MKTTMYRVQGERNDEWIDTIIAVPDYLPEYDPLDEDDVPLFIKRELDLDFLEDYRAVETA
jgi:hypothetical protein